VHAIDDEPFDADAVARGAWRPPYGAGDTLGTYNEVDAAGRARALALLDPARGVRAFNLGEAFYPGFPAFGSRTFHQALYGSGFAPTAGVETARSRPWGPNRLTSLEERVTFSFNMGAKINGLAHCGVGDVLYGGRSLAEVVAGGARALDTTTFATPLVTRGLLLDVLGYYLANDRTDALAQSPDGLDLVRGDHRITVEDLAGCADRAGIGAIEPGDAVLLRTGWRRLLRTDPARYLAANPGVFLRETRWLAQFRPALVGADTWCFETIDPAVAGRLVTPCHQELFVRFGIRLGEGLALDELADAGVAQFVFCHAPLPSEGAISSNAPPVALASVAP
jgi:Putative cyclase